jgi:hypothetical protein
MNQEQAENLIEKAILDAKLTHAWRWSIVMRNRKVLCIPRRSRFSNDEVIVELTRQQITHGLTPEMWTAFGRSLVKYWKEQTT